MSAPEQKYYYVKSKTVPVANTQTTSAGVNIEGQAVVGLSVPSGFVGAGLEIQVSEDNTNWGSAKLADGSTPLNFAAVAASEKRSLEAYITIPWRFVRIVCTGAQTGVNFTLKTRQI